MTNLVAISLPNYGQELFQFLFFMLAVVFLGIWTGIQEDKQ
jgi:hypothetical protein